MVSWRRAANLVALSCGHVARYLAPPIDLVHVCIHFKEALHTRDVAVFGGDPEGKIPQLGWGRDGGNDLLVGQEELHGIEVAFFRGDVDGEYLLAQHVDVCPQRDHLQTKRGARGLWIGVRPPLGA